MERFNKILMRGTVAAVIVVTLTVLVWGGYRNKENYPGSPWKELGSDIKNFRVGELWGDLWRKPPDISG